MLNYKKVSFYLLFSLMLMVLFVDGEVVVDITVVAKMKFGRKCTRKAIFDIFYCGSNT